MTALLRSSLLLLMLAATSQAADTVRLSIDVSSEKGSDRSGASRPTRPGQSSSFQTPGAKADTYYATVRNRDFEKLQGLTLEISLHERKSDSVVQTFRRSLTLDENETKKIKLGVASFRNRRLEYQDRYGKKTKDDYGMYGGWSAKVLKGGQVVYVDASSTKLKKQLEKSLSR